MTKAELLKWIEHSIEIECYGNYDENGNYNGYTILEVDSKLYRIDYCNGSPVEKYGDHGYIRGVYEPIEVKKQVKIVEKVEYVPVN